MATPPATRPAPAAPTPTHSPLYSAVIGLAGLGVLLQGLWAGLFIREGHDNNDHWVHIHARGAEVTIAVAAVATLIAFLQLRSRPGVIVGSVVFVVLLVVESYIGGMIGAHSALQGIHFPPATALPGPAGIGRAPGRGRVGNSGGAGSFKKKKRLYRA